MAEIQIVHPFSACTFCQLLCGVFYLYLRFSLIIIYYIYIYIYMLNGISAYKANELLQIRVHNEAISLRVLSRIPISELPIEDFGRRPFFSSSSSKINIVIIFLWQTNIAFLQYWTTMMQWLWLWTNYHCMGECNMPTVITFKSLQITNRLGVQKLQLWQTMRDIKSIPVKKTKKCMTF